ncbi:uracil-DNA glycosylase-like isoform X2 [Cylas formicarius]|nr:uracil-DNA glycosylase-like isoform X2 [Cylas formicarius]
MADGLSFSCSDTIGLIPGSLRNIIKEIFKQFHRPHDANRIERGVVSTELEHLARQGVLLLNSILTVGSKKSHKSIGWVEITDEIISWLARECDGIVFLLFGTRAHEKTKFIRNPTHCIIKTSHPSAISYKKDGGDKYKSFCDSGCFWACNKFFEDRGLDAIDWIPELAGFWMLSTFIQFPLQAFLLFDSRLQIYYIQVAAQGVMFLLLSIELICGYCALKYTANQQANYYRIVKLRNEIDGSDSAIKKSK